MVEKKISAESKCLKREKIQLSFSEIVPEKKTQNYFVRIEAVTGTEDFINYRFNEYLEEEKYEGGNLKIGDVDTKKDLCMRIYDEQKDTYVSKGSYIGSFLLLVIVEICYGYCICCEERKKK